MNDVSRCRDGHLLVVLSNPPTTSGIRTLQRVELARETLGYSSVAAANLFGIPTYRTGGISAVGIESNGWFTARAELREAIGAADAVILAYGCQEPSGFARQQFRDQLAWLEAAIEVRDLPRWMIDGRPRHPSRWHRHTYAKHPELTFAEALPLVLLEVKPTGRHPRSDGTRFGINVETTDQLFG